MEHLQNRLKICFIDTAIRRRLTRPFMVLGLESLIKVTIIVIGTRLYGQTTHMPRSVEFTERFDTPSKRNAASCSECHLIPVLGGSSKVAVVHTSQLESDTDAGNLGIEGPPASVRTRITLPTLGDGLLEVVSDQTIEKLASKQVKASHGGVHGQVARVAIPGSSKGMRAVGRFGWKAQHATLMSAAANALYTELGVPNDFFVGRYLRSDDNVSNSPSATGTKRAELDHIVTFLRQTEPVEADPKSNWNPSATLGSSLFDEVGCALCHTRTMQTAPPGTTIQGGTYKVPLQLGGRTIHPYSDLLLHDVGTGDRVAQNISLRDYDSSTLNKFRTPPLWGLRFRNWLMHDGKSVTVHQAILRHSGEASTSVGQYRHLPPLQKEALWTFLGTL